MPLISWKPIIVRTQNIERALVLALASKVFSEWSGFNSKIVSEGKYYNTL